MTGASFTKGGGALTCWRVMATRAVWSAMMDTLEAEPSKSLVPEESKARARKERLEPAGMLPRMPPQTPLEEGRSTETEGKSAALVVTVTRETEEARAWGTETTNWAEPVSEEAAQLTSSARESA